MSVLKQYNYISQWTPINTPVKMPPKAAVDAAPAVKPAKAKATKAAVSNKALCPLS